MNGGGGSGGGGGGSGEVSPPHLEAMSRLAEGISLVFSQWTALQVAVVEQWGGRDSRRKADDLASLVLSWFTYTKSNELYIDDLENILDQNMEELLAAVLEDGSIEEVAQQLMLLHEDCLKGNFESIEKLRNQGFERNAVRESRMVIADDEDDSSDDEDMSDMMVDESKPQEIVAQQPKSKDMVDEDGWSVVSRKNRGKRSGLTW